MSKARTSSSWPSVRLAEAMWRSRETTEIDPSETYREVTVRLWGKGAGLRRSVLGSQIAATRRGVARAGQFILSRIDARNGALAIVPRELDGALVSNDFPTFNLNSSKLTAKYLGWLCRTKDFVALCQRASEGTTNRVRLQEASFLDFEIPLPPLSEQRRIVARIEELAGRIDEVRTTSRLVGDEADALILSLNTSLAGSRTKRLGEILQLDEDSTPVTPTGSYPQVGVKSFGGGLFAKTALFGSETTYRAFNRLYEGALVLSQVKGWEGAIAVCPSSLSGWFVSPEYRTFRFDPTEARPGYFAALVRTEWFWQRLGSATRGVGARRERTRPEQFLAVEVAIPEVRLQEHGEEVFSRVGGLKRLQAETQAELDALLLSMLDRAFKGEL